MKKIIICLLAVLSYYSISAQDWNLNGNVPSSQEFKFGTLGGGFVPDPQPDFEIIHYGNTMARFEHEFINFAPGSNTKILIGDPSVTTPNGYKLYVEEGIMTERVKVALTNSSDWADYVFYKDYPLMTLPKIESFINRYGHLPHIPSAKELETQGLDLGDMQAKQMAKIEELTLHLIQKDKEVKVLQKEVELLQKQVALLLAKQ